MPEPISVLCVDPDERCVQQYAAVLPQPGWRLVHANTFLEALDHVTTAAFDFAIIELKLPDAVGTDVWRHIKRLQPGIRGIMTTDSPSLRGLINVAEPDILAYLLKPFEVDSVWAMIDRAIPQ